MSSIWSKFAYIYVQIISFHFQAQEEGDKLSMYFQRQSLLA